MSAAGTPAQPAGSPRGSVGHLYHLTLAKDWERALEKHYETSTLGVSLSEQGFLHCSFRRQVQQAA